MKRILSWLIGLPVTVVLVAFAVANRTWIDISFDPLTPADPWLAVSAPIWSVLFAGIFLGLMTGWLAAWFNQGKHRKAARQARADLASANSENRKLQQAQPGALVPASGAGRSAG